MNAKTYPDLVVDHKRRKTDYQFNLEVAGRPKVESPGPHAVTTVSK